MERILQMLSQKSPSMNPLSLFTSNNNINQIKPIKQETIEKPETTAIQLEVKYYSIINFIHFKIIE